MSENFITWEGNIARLDPIEYKLVAKKSGPWWCRREKYEVHSPYGVISGFESASQARFLFRIAGEEIQDASQNS